MAFEFSGHLANWGVKFTATPNYLAPDDDAAANGLARMMFVKPDSFFTFVGPHRVFTPQQVVAQFSGGNFVMLSISQMDSLKSGAGLPGALFATPAAVDAFFATANGVSNPGLVLTARGTPIATFGSM